MLLPQTDRITSRRRFFQYLAASPLVTHIGAPAFAHHRHDYRDSRGEVRQPDSDCANLQQPRLSSGRRGRGCQGRKNRQPPSDALHCGDDFDRGRDCSARCTGMVSIIPDAEVGSRRSPRQTSGASGSNAEGTARARRRCRVLDGRTHIGGAAGTARCVVLFPGRRGGLYTIGADKPAGHPRHGDGRHAGGDAGLRRALGAQRAAALLSYLGASGDRRDRADRLALPNQRVRCEEPRPQPARSCRSRRRWRRTAHAPGPGSTHP